MKEHDRRRSREFRDRYSHLVRATRVVRAALRRGDLVRPSTCSRCGKVCTPEAHHHSYEEEDLLDVEWLYRRCHAAEHDGVVRITEEEVRQTAEELESLFPESEDTFHVPPDANTIPG